MNDLERAYNALAGKQRLYNDRWAYYHGTAPLAFANEARVREIFRGLGSRCTENWAAVVVDTACDRINLSAINVPKAQQDLLAFLWDENEMALVADDAHEAALVCGEAFIIVWPDEAGETRVYYNDPRLCHVFYDADYPNVMRLAAKWYVGDDKRYRLTLYYPDHLEYYVSTFEAENVQAATAFVRADPPDAVNPYGVVPVFHLRTRRDGRGDLENVIPLQNGVNKLLSEMIVLAEYGAFPQRYIISNADTSALKNAPNELWNIPAGDGVGQQTAVGQFAPADLKNYLDAIDRLSQAIGIITRTPKHYFFGQGGDPSGEALIALEAPLNKKCGDYIKRFTPTWRAVAAFMLQVAGQPVAKREIQPIFERPETVQPYTQALTRKTSWETGMALTTLLRAEGWTESQLAQMAQDKRAEGAQQQASLASALVEAQRRMDQGQA